MIRLIAALDIKRGIARGGKLPWRIPADLKYFKEQTLQYGGVVAMGRKTYESIGHVLPGRTILVLSKSKVTDAGIVIMNSIEAATEYAPDIWVAGGEDIYSQTIDIADELYLTHILDDFSCDQFFPEYSQFESFYKSEVKSHAGLGFYYEKLRR